jgi:hypothetical protein
MKGGRQARTTAPQAIVDMALGVAPELDRHQAGSGASGSGVFRESTLGRRTPHRTKSSQRSRLQLDVQEFVQDTVSKEAERLASETCDLLFYSKFLERVLTP